MTVLPIAARELRVIARRRSTHWSRFSAAALAIGVAVWVLFTSGYVGGRVAQAGQEVFEMLSWCGFFYALLIGVRATADCISEEKREGTLGLLFLTDLKGYDVVFGKLFSSSLTAFYSLLAMIPIMAIPVMLGGVSGQLLWRTAAVLINTMFLSLSIGLCVSAIGRHERKAMVTTFLLILLLTLGIPALGAWLEDAIPGITPSDMPQIFNLVSPGYLMGYRDSTGGEFGASFATVHVVAWAFLLVSCWRLPRAWQDKVSSTGRLRLVEWVDGWMRGAPEQRVAARRRMLEINPVLWLTARDRRDLIYVGAFLIGCAVIWGVGLWRSPRSWLEEFAYFFTAVVLHTVIKIWMATQACQRFGEDRRSGALELMLSTPLSVEEILRGQVLALKRQFERPVALILVIDFVFVLGCIHREFNLNQWRNPTDLNNWLPVLIFVTGMVMLVVDAYAIAWSGMWVGLTTRQSNRAAISVVGRVMALPWLVFCMGLPFIFAALFFRNGRNSAIWLLGLWLVMGLVNSYFWYQQARTNLLSRFREIATQRIDVPKAGWFRRLFSSKVTDAPPVTAQS